MADPALRDKLVTIGAAALGATVVIGGGFWLLEGASRRDALKLRIITALEPADRDLLKSLVQETRIATSELTASMDRLSEKGIDVNLLPFGKK